jgi:glycerol-3-phosphate dehydrogenase
MELQSNEPELKENFIQITSTPWQVAWAIRYEMARTIDDVLARRVRLLFLDARAAVASCEKVAKLLKGTRP